jgi:hypothetical protein
MKTSILRALFVVATLFVFSNAAFAQYVWLDEKGAKQFSDQPPPPSVPKNKILKYSGKSMDSQDAASDADSDKSKDAKPAESIADKEADYKKRHDEMAKQQKKSADAAAAAAAKADNCNRMRQYKSTLDSGQRISQSDASGNRSYMTDDQRAQEQSKLTQNLGDCGN